MIGVNVAGLLREPPGTVRAVALEVPATGFDPSLPLAGPVRGVVRLQRTNRGLLVSGPITTSVWRTCVRCLDDFVADTAITINEEFLPSVDVGSGAPLPVDATDADVRRIDAHHELDLGPIVGEELVMAEPMHAVCRPDCPGLCPGCGRHLDVGRCECDVASLDPRLAGLARFRPPDGR